MTTTPIPAPTSTAMKTHAVDEKRLSAATGMDAVTLRVGDLETMSDYYSNALAMEPLEEAVRDGEVHRVLGRGTTPLVKLAATPGLPGVDPKQAGLFHTAFLFDTKEALAATVAHAAQNTNSTFVGSSDHLVSQAFYFTDPEGNGIELYVDRARSEWTRSLDGEVQMDTLYLDPNRFLERHLDQDILSNTAAEPGVVGHVHLQVLSIQQAREFYVDALGFEPSLSSMPGVLFAAAGGYHHHVAMNTWNSRGAGPRAASLGLGDVAITVPGREDLDSLVARLRAHNLDYADDGRSVRVTDPWGTQVTLATGTSSIDEALAR